MPVSEIQSRSGELIGFAAITPALTRPRPEAGVFFRALGARSVLGSSPTE